MRGRNFEQNRYGTRPKNTVITQTAKNPDSAELLEQFYQYQKAKRYRAWRRSGIVLFGLLLIAFVSWQSYAYYQHQQPTSQIPKSIRQNATFPLYAPDEASYKIIKGTASYDNDILMYQTSSVGSSDLYTVTEQLKPIGFDISQYKTNQGLTNVNELTLPSGKAISGKVLNKSVLILVADKTLISVVPASATNTQLPEELARSLVQIKH